MAGRSSISICGRFQAIDSFAVRRRGEFYIIGQLTEGEIQEQWYAHVTLNASLALTLKIAQIETVEISGESEEYKLLVVTADSEEVDFFLALGIGSEPIIISTEGTE